MITINKQNGRLIRGTSSGDSITNGDYRNNGGSRSTIMSGDGNDTIENWGSFSSINCGAGNDYIYIPSDIWYLSGARIEFANGVSIEGGKGNDTLESYGSGTVYIYNNGDGNDSIVGFDDDDTLLIASGTWSTAKSGNNVIVTVGNGKITLRGAASLSAVNIVSSMEDVHPVTFISNSRVNTLITGTSYKDSIYNDKASNVTINGGADEDTLSNVGGSNVSISAGDGNDIINNRLPTYASGRVDTDFLSCKNVTLLGGKGNDYIFNNIVKVTINGGAGDDSIDNYSGNTGDVTGLGASVSIYGGAGNDSISNSGDNVTISGGAGNDTIESWSGRNSTIIGGKGDDLTSLSSFAEKTLIKYAAGDGSDTVYGFNETSTLSITGGSYSTTESGNDVIVNVGNGKITLLNVVATASVLHINDKNISLGKSIELTDGDDTIESTRNDVTINCGDGNDSIDILGSATTVKCGEGNDTVWNYGGSKNVSINGEDDTDKIVNFASDNVTIDGGDGDDSIYNYGDNVTINGEAGNDYISNEEGSNVTMTGGTGNDTIANNYNITGGFAWYDNAGSNVLFKYTEGDGNDIIYGFNDSSTLQIGNGTGTYSTKSSGLDIIVTVGNGKITLQGAASLKTLHIDGVKQVQKIYNNSSAAKVTLSSGIDIGDASSRTAAIRIVGNAKGNSVLGGSKNDTLYGKDGADYLVGNAGNDKLYGQNDADTLWGGAGNDTLIGGAGDDLFIYSAGKDLIYDYAAGDRISLGAAITNATVSGSNVVLTTGNGSLTVKGGKNKTLSLITSTGKELETIIGSDKATYTDSSTAKVTLASTYTTADATARTKAIRIVGNAKDNSILGGTKGDTLYGGDGDDYLEGNEGSDKLYGQDGTNTLVGGAGNDSLWGSDGDDTFLYNAGDGKDVIFGFDDDDMLQISGTFSAKYYAGSDKIVFKVGSTAGAITLKNFTADTFNINGDTYQISGTKLVKK